ncbi:MAG TPA: hypothetical protein PLA88_03125 [Bacteroidales bacterium]|nr:hypothetical protein [Bacteroidales bacterium]
MPIRLFTSGVHTNATGSLNFSNEDIERLYSSTVTKGPDQIPIVLGHPKNNLPIVGWLPRTAICKYQEGDKVSLGFERQAAELSDPSMEVIRQQKSNKISVRIQDGVINHIGLVAKAAVEENNAQNFSAEFTGVYHTSEEILEPPVTDFSRFMNEVKSFFKTANMPEEKKEQTAPSADFTALVEQNKQLAASVTALQQTVAGFMNRSKATADFAADDFKHMSAAQKETAASIATELGEEKATALKTLLKELAKQPVTVTTGSVTTQFGKTADQKRTSQEVIDEQMKGLGL